MCRCRWQRSIICNAMMWVACAPGSLAIYLWPQGSWRSVLAATLTSAGPCLRSLIWLLSAFLPAMKSLARPHAGHRGIGPAQLIGARIAQLALPRNRLGLIVITLTVSLRRG